MKRVVLATIAGIPIIIGLFIYGQNFSTISSDNPLSKINIGTENFFQISTSEGLRYPTANIYDSNPGSTGAPVRAVRPLYYLTAVDNNTFTGKYVKVTIPPDGMNHHCQLAQSNGQQVLTGDSYCELAAQVYYSFTKASLFFSALGYWDRSKIAQVCIQCSNSGSHGGGGTSSLMTFSDTDISEHKEDILKYVFFVGLHEMVHLAQSTTTAMDNMTTKYKDWGTNITEGTADFFAGVLSGQAVIGSSDNSHTVYSKNSFFGRDWFGSYDMSTPFNSSLYEFISVYILTQKSPKTNYESLLDISKIIMQVYMEYNQNSLSPANFLNGIVGKLNLLKSPQALVMNYKNIVLNHGLDLNSLSKNDGQTSGLLINGRGLILGMNQIVQSSINSHKTNFVSLEMQNNFFNDPNFKKPFRLQLYPVEKSQIQELNSCMINKGNLFIPQITTRLQVLRDENRNNSIVGILSNDFTLGQLNDPNIVRQKLFEKCNQDLHFNLDLTINNMNENQKSLFLSCANGYMSKIIEKTTNMTIQIPDDAIIGIIDPTFTYKQFKEQKYQWIYEKICNEELGPLEVHDPTGQSVVGEIDFKKSGSKYSRTIEINTSQDLVQKLYTDFAKQSSCPRKIGGVISLKAIDSSGKLAGTFGAPYYLCAQ